MSEAIDQKENFVTTQHHEGTGPLAFNLQVTRFQVIFAIWIAWSAWMVNFDLGYGGTVLQMPAFLESFGSCTLVSNPETGVLEQTCVLGAVAQSMVAISSLFVAIGSGFSAIPGHFLGRRGTIHAGLALVVIGAASQCGTSGNYVAYNVCKCISTFGVGIVVAVGPTYGVECTAPQKRGALVAMFAVGLTTGQLVSAAVCLGTSNLDSDWAWRTPVILQIPFAIIYAVGILAFPESPRWLMTKGKEEQARKSFARYYNKDPNSEQISAQVREVQMYIEFEKNLSSTTSWTEMFHRKYIRRTFISCLVTSAQALSGVAFVVNYLVVFLVATGVHDPYLILVYLSVCGVAGSLIGPFVVEFGGRRFAQICGFGLLSTCMLIFSSVASGIGPTTTTAKNTLVAFLCIWFFFFSSFIASNGWTISAEVHSVRLRTYGQAFAMFCGSTFAFGVTFWTPYMINPTVGNMGTKVGYFYFGLEFFFCITLFFVLPETARLSLEQIDDYFESGPKPWRTSLSRNKKIAKGQVFDISPQEHEAAYQAANTKSAHGDASEGH